MKLESRKDELDLAIKDLDETYEQEMDSHQDIRVYVEEKVIKKEDEVDFMIDREEVIFFYSSTHLLTKNFDFRISLKPLKNKKLH